MDDEQVPLFGGLSRKILVVKDVYGMVGSKT